jgi:hypothetical protein
MLSPDLSELMDSFARGVYNVTIHGYQEKLHDQITIATLESTLGKDDPEVLENYPDNEQGPCCLVLAWTPKNVPLHAVIGYGGD